MARIFVDTSSMRLRATNDIEVGNYVSVHFMALGPHTHTDTGNDGLVGFHSEGQTRMNVAAANGLSPRYELNVGGGGNVDEQPAGIDWWANNGNHNAWKSVGFASHSATDHRCYWEGYEVASSTTSITAFTPSYIDVGFAFGWNYTDYWICEMAVWDRPLDPAEWRQISLDRTASNIRAGRILYLPLRISDKEEFGRDFVPANNPGWGASPKIRKLSSFGPRSVHHRVTKRARDVRRMHPGRFSGGV